MIKPKDRYWISLLPVLALWLVIAIPYTLRTPDDAYAHDFHGHVQYSQLLHELKRLPLAGECWECRQPPLYYLLTSQLAFASAHHVLCVRLFAVLLGALTLFMLHRALQHLGIGVVPTLLTLIFCATTPAFLFVFSTYNNDALVTFLGISFWVLFLLFVKEGGPPSQAVGLGLLMLAGCFTKFSFGATAISVYGAAIYLRVRGTLTSRAFNRFAACQLLVIPLILGWMYVHNYQDGGTWLGLNALDVPLQRLPHSQLQTILTPPGFTSWEWTTPYTDHFLPIGKKNSLTAYAWVSSIFGEHTFPKMQDFWLWFILWVHTAWFVAGLTQIRRTPITTVMGIALGGGWLALAAHLLFVPYGSIMDFRFVAWLWLPFVVLKSHAVEHPPSWLAGRIGQRLCLTVILLGITVQWALITLL